MTTVMFYHIRTILPQIVKEIDIQIECTQSDLNDLGDGVPESNQGKLQLIWNLSLKFIDIFKS